MKKTFVVRQGEVLSKGTPVSRLKKDQTCIRDVRDLPDLILIEAFEIPLCCYVCHLPSVGRHPQQ